jgi:methionyl-tRNA formyltransferase
MRLAFLGTPDASVVSLRALVGAGHDVVLVITRPDRRRGRGSATSPSPVKAAALELGLNVSHDIDDLVGLDIERGVVVAYGSLIRAAVLEQLPMLNVHFSLLPRWRGAAPVEWAILAGDEKTGVSVMTLEVALDTGPVHLAREALIGDKTASELLEELSQLGATALLEVLSSPDLLAHPRVQEGNATYAGKLTSDTFHVVPDMDQSLMLRTVRLGRAFTLVNGRRMRILRAHEAQMTGSAGTLSVVDATVVLEGALGALGLDEVQPEGSTAMSAASWWAGARLDSASAVWS